MTASGSASAPVDLLTKARPKLKLLFECLPNLRTRVELAVRPLRLHFSRGSEDDPFLARV